METNTKSHLLLLLLALLHVCFAQNDCPETDPILTDLTCSTDYNQIITCVWNNARVSEHPNTVCTVEAQKTSPPPKDNGRFSYRSCTLTPVDASNPSLMSCVMDLNKNQTFQHFVMWSITLRCNSTQQNLSFPFKPFCSVKLGPPGQPEVNFTTVSWLSKAPNQRDVKNVKSQLQWKREDQSWTDPSLKPFVKDCEQMCETHLDPDELFQGQRYEARTRVMVNHLYLVSTWSDWGPTTSWVSPIGKTKPPDITGDIWGMIIAGAATVAVLLVVILLRKNTTTWVVEKIRGPAIPSPATSFLQKTNFQNWLSPHFTSESFYSFSKHEEILYVEVTSPLDAVAPCKPEAALLEKIKSEGSSGSGSSSFSNPSYSHLCSPPAISSLSAGNLQPCAADSPYGPVGDQSGEQNKEDESGKECEIMTLLSKGSNSGGSVQVIQDYEKVEKPQLERTRLQSLDSGMCSGEEVSQESLESDSITVADSHEEEPVDREEEEDDEKTGIRGEVDFKKLFEGSGGTLGKGTIQVCSGYERVQALPAGSSELSSQDSGISSGGEEQMSQEESPEDVDKATEPLSFPLRSAPFFPPPFPMPSLAPQPLKVSGVGIRTDLQTLLSHMGEKNALTSNLRSLEASGDGYMPVKQEQS